MPFPKPIVVNGKPWALPKPGKQWAVIEESDFGETGADYFEDETSASENASTRIDRIRKSRGNEGIVLVVQIREVYCTPNAPSCRRLHDVPASTYGWTCQDPSAPYDRDHLCDYAGEFWWGPHHEARRWLREEDAKKEADFWSSDRAKGSDLFRERIVVRYS